MNTKTHDPIKDDKKQYTLREWVETAKAELDSYLSVWENINDFHKQPHTWNEWLRAFVEYMSW